MTLAIATAKNLYTLEASETIPRKRIEGVSIQQIAVKEDRILVALEDGSLCVVTPEVIQRTFTGIPEPIASLAILRCDPLTVLLGTDESAFLYRWQEGDVSARRVPTFDALPCRARWHTPWGGPAAVRSLAVSGKWVYADIHVGSIMRSPDEGVTWEPVTPELNEDVHQVATTPAHPSRVVANTANAVYVSDDYGHSWTHRARGLSARYGRAVAVSPKDADLLLASVSRGPRGGEARLFRSENGGGSWEPVNGDFPEALDRNIDTYHVTFTEDGIAWALVENRLYRGTESARFWSLAWEAPETLRRLAS